ncbi:MAG: phosphoribosylformylglycinamidine cyclo-ligase [Chloroflexia bacterium]|nr:phosphoribosylformylglycinamidine cyclo-ligase [Chloroflexia bacterium]
MGLTYKDAGVDIDAKANALAQVQARAAATLGTSAGPIGHFGGTFRVAGGDRLLVASADGVGTKLRLAFLLGAEAHAGIGRDLVHHCVNDVLALGATPLFFLDYFATGRLDPEVMNAVVDGVADACTDQELALLGGETAEMPDMYAPGEYDLAGFIVGEVSPDRVVDGSAVRPGDVVIGLLSEGLHTNGYSLARRIIGLTGDAAQDRVRLFESLPGAEETIGAALMRGHRCYRRAMRPLLAQDVVRGMAHITGGGLPGNLPRTLPDDCIAVLDPALWPVPPVIAHLVERGELGVVERYRVFNMGIGFVLIVGAEHAAPVLTALDGASVIGEIIARTTSDEFPVQGLTC